MTFVQTKEDNNKRDKRENFNVKMWVGFDLLRDIL